MDLSQTGCPGICAKTNCNKSFLNEFQSRNISSTQHIKNVSQSTLKKKVEIVVWISTFHWGPQNTNMKLINRGSKRFSLTQPRPHYTVFKRKRYCFVPDTATVHTTTVRKRIVLKTLSTVERFENGTVWKHCFPSVDGENDTIWKRWRHHNNTTWL